MTFGRHWIAAAVSVPLLLVGGCSEDPEPIIEPPAETTPASDPSPTATPEAKEPWEKKTKAGAVAFAEHWIGVFSEAITSGESEGLREVSAVDCTACSAIVDRIDAIERAGGFYDSRGWRVLQVSQVEKPTDGGASMAVRVLQSAERFKETAESEVVRHPSSRATYAMTMDWSGGRWRMSEMRLLA